MNVGTNIANPKGSHLNFEHFAGTFGNTHRVEIVTGKCKALINRFCLFFGNVINTVNNIEKSLFLCKRHFEKPLLQKNILLLLFIIEPTCT